MGSRRRRRKQLLGDVKEMRGYWILKEETLDQTLWRTRLEGTMDLSYWLKDIDNVQREGVEENICLGWRRKGESRIMRSFKILEPCHVLTGSSRQGRWDDEGMWHTSECVTYRFLTEHLKEKNLKDLGVDTRVLLKRILIKKGVRRAQTYFACIRHVYGPLWTGWWIFKFDKHWGISWKAKDLFCIEKDCAPKR
jgi:hypothetical protein